MDTGEQSTSFSSNSLPLKKRATDQSSDDEVEKNIDDVLGLTEQESDLGLADGDNVDDSKDYDVDEYADDGDEDRDIEDNEEATGDRPRSQANQPGLVSDAFDAFEFVRQDANVPVSDSAIEEEAIPEASDWLDGEKLYTAHIQRARNFVCIDYPGVIKNKDKALATLGGLEGLSKAITEDLKLELFFRPNDPYCKPTIGSYTPTKNLLLKMRRRRKANKPVAGSSSSVEDEFEYQLEVIGVVNRVYFFDKLCDFQYLPVIKEPNGKYKEILSSIRPNIKDDRTEYLSRNVPVFLPPISFSRRDTPVCYSFDTETVQPGEDADNVVIGFDRKKRSLGTIHIFFARPDVPKQPDPITFDHLKKLPCQDEGLAALRKLFEERPLWSKVGILARLDKSHHNYLKYLLPIIAFYFVNGPWKNLWCRFGYDPRKDPTSKIYQTLDYRVRSTANRQKVEPKRGQEVLRTSHYSQKPQWYNAVLLPDDTAETPPMEIAAPIDLTYIFTPDHIPPYRQMRYQVCDVHIEGVQRRAHENDGQETTCTERDGWCVPDFTDVCRDLISAAVDKLFAK